jgi:hypothetical protein
VEIGARKGVGVEVRSGSDLRYVSKHPPKKALGSITCHITGISELIVSIPFFSTKLRIARRWVGEMRPEKVLHTAESA